MGLSARLAYAVFLLLALFVPRRSICTTQSNFLSGPVTAGGGSSSGGITAPQPANLSGCPKLSIAVINGVKYHYEVLSGLLYILQPYAQRTHVYVDRGLYKSTDGVWEILRRFQFTYKTVEYALSSKTKRIYDLVILVSPEYELETLATLLRRIQRRVTVAMVHNSDSSHIHQLIKEAAGRGGSVVKLVTLAEHNARWLAAATGRPVEWVLAVNPHSPQRKCMQASTEMELLGGCLQGFSIQGKFSNSRRNYSALWQQMLEHQDDIFSPEVAPLFRVNVLGKGTDSELHVPAALLSHVSVHKGLAFQSFYDIIHHTFALLPLFGSARYFTTKFSSTVLTSLIDGVPLIADQHFLSTYTMFSEDSVYLQREGEREIDVMLRVLHMPLAEALSVRRSLLDVRHRLNARAAEFYAGVLANLCTGS